MRGAALFADYYEFTMLRVYFERRMFAPATFSLYVRKPPPSRNFLLACGLSDLLDEISALCFGAADIAYLRSLGDFSEPFLEWLRAFRFTGDIFAMREGTPFFQEEPALEITAPLPEAQLLETLVLNRIGLQTTLASKAARIVAAARGRPVCDFGARRAPGADAAIKGVRAFYVAGVASTSNVAGSFTYGVPPSGTMAHSFVEACDSEMEAFERFAAAFPHATLLVDTYDTIAGVKKAIALAQRQDARRRLGAVRLDSGDLDALSRAVRALLDEAGLSDVRIVASGGLDEQAIDRLTASGAPIDLFGVGGAMAASVDAPLTDFVYKLTEYAGAPRMKLSPEKRSLPGRKQVFRQFETGRAVCDEIGLRDERLPGEPLLQPVMLGGRRVDGERRTLTQIRDHARAAIDALPPELRAISRATTPYEVGVSAAAEQLERETRELILARELRENTA
jgi:nicotinate phosphoribosyltransferase